MFRLRVPARDAAQAEAICDALLSALEPDTSTAGLVDTETGWVAEAFYLDEPDEAALAAHLRRMLGPGASGLGLRVESIADRDWVRQSLEAMPPVFAGRFAVFGRHDRKRIPSNALGIEIEASCAFGTGHHGTTLGCLLALDALFKARRFRRPIDIGTGTGVLAIATAKALRVPVLATDIDPVAVKIAEANAAKNRVGTLVAAVRADGLEDRRIRAAAPYDLIVANILAKPLVALAPDVARSAERKAVAVLSGLRAGQRRQVEAAWRAFGFRPLRRLVIDGWATLVLVADARLTSRRASSRWRVPRASGRPRPTAARRAG